MGVIALPANGTVYLDANSIIYTVELVEPYRTTLQPVWAAARTGSLSIATSDLTLLEVLVKPLKIGNKSMEKDFRSLLQGTSDVRLLTITHPILERAANLRASTNLKTPDALHAATALVAGCTLFVTNDPAFKRVPGLTVAVLSEVIAAP